MAVSLESVFTSSTTTLNKLQTSQVAEKLWHGPHRRHGEKLAGVQYRKQPGRWRWCADDMIHR